MATRVEHISHLNEGGLLLELTSLLGVEGVGTRDGLVAYRALLVESLSVWDGVAFPGLGDSLGL